MKQLANLVSFDPVGKEVIFETKFFHYVSLETLLLVVNTTRNEIIYNLADPELGAEDFGATLVPSGTQYTLNLKAPCTGHASTDSISIFYDDKTDTTDWVQGPDVPVVRTILYANESGGVDNGGRIVSSNNPLPVTANLRSEAYDAANDVYWGRSVIAIGDAFGNVEPELVNSSNPLPISGTVKGTSAGFTQVSGTAPAFSNVVLEANSNRKYLLIQNLSTAPFYINFSGSATVHSVRIDGGGSIVFESTAVPTNAIQMIRSVADQSYTILHA